MAGGKLGNALRLSEEIGQICIQRQEQTSKNNAEQEKPDKKKTCNHFCNLQNHPNRRLFKVANIYEWPDNTGEGLHARLSTSVSKKRGIREEEGGGNLKQQSLQERVHSILDTTAPSLKKIMASICWAPRHHAKGADVEIRYRLGILMSNVHVI